MTGALQESKQWLVYWRKEEIQAAVFDRLLDHAASEQKATGNAFWEPAVQDTGAPAPKRKVP
jgi:hypothetical protein